MTSKSKKKRKRKDHERRLKSERRFEPRASYTSLGPAVAGMVGAAAAGAGVYGQWIQDAPLDYAAYLTIGGGIVLGAALWFGDRAVAPVRVGDAGVGAERRSDLVRLPWCDIRQLRVDKGQLIVEADQLSIRIALAAHPAAVSLVLSEAMQRIPDRVDVHTSVMNKLPKARKDERGEEVPVETLQITGRKCAASGKRIAFERDARLCGNCAQVYHKEHVPNACASCEQDLGARTLVIS